MTGLTRIQILLTYFLKWLGYSLKLLLILRTINSKIDEERELTYADIEESDIVPDKYFSTQN